MSQMRQNKLKIAITLFLIGIALPSILYFYQDDRGIILEIPLKKVEKRKLTYSELDYLEFLLKRLHNYFLGKEKRENFNMLGRYYEILGEKYDLDKEYFHIFKISLLKQTYGREYITNTSFLVEIEERIPISYKKIIGVGIVFIFLGLGFLISYLFKVQKEKKSRHKVVTS